jgi:hypothetical protein
MRIFDKTWFSLPCMVAVSAISIQAVYAQPPKGRPRGGPPSGRPDASAGPPSVDEVFERFDGNKDGKLQKEEVPEFIQQFILPADANGDDVVTKEELQVSRQRQRPDGEGLPAEGAPRPPNRPGRPERAAGDHPASSSGRTR